MIYRKAVAVFVLLLVGCATTTPVKIGGTGAENARDMQLQPVDFVNLPGWAGDDQTDALAAFRKSCAVMMKRGDTTPVAPTAIAGTIADWRPACVAAIGADNAKEFFTTYFTPYKATTSAGDTGLFTGYHESILRGSLVKTPQYAVPLYKKPADLVTVELSDFKPEWHGQRIGGNVVAGRLKPYVDRKAIDDGALTGKGLELLYVDDVNDAFFLGIQGSGRVHLPDGRVVRVGYDGQNGRPYYAIGRDLIARGALTPATVSMQTIRAWLDAHPTDAVALRQKNPSYVFFKIAEGETDGPIGAQNVSLTAERSLAVDPHFVPYGAPVFVNAPHPQTGAMLQRLLVAQDTGGAIRGPVRGDVFWGSDKVAEETAGMMKSRGVMWVLLPKTLHGPRQIPASPQSASK